MASCSGCRSSAASLRSCSRSGCGTGQATLTGCQGTQGTSRPGTLLASLPPCSLPPETPPVPCLHCFCSSFGTLCSLPAALLPLAPLSAFVCLPRFDWYVEELAQPHPRLPSVIMKGRSITASEHRCTERKDTMGRSAPGRQSAMQAAGNAYSHSHSQMRRQPTLGWPLSPGALPLVLPLLLVLNLHPASKTSRNRKSAGQIRNTT